MGVMKGSSIRSQQTLKILCVCRNFSVLSLTKVLNLSVYEQRSDGTTPKSIIDRHNRSWCHKRWWPTWNVECGVCSRQTVTSTEAQQQNTTQVQIIVTIPFNYNLQDPTVMWWKNCCWTMWSVTTRLLVTFLRDKQTFSMCSLSCKP